LAETVATFGYFCREVGSGGSGGGGRGGRVCAEGGEIALKFTSERWVKTVGIVEQRKSGQGLKCRTTVPLKEGKTKVEAVEQRRNKEYRKIGGCV